MRLPATDRAFLIGFVLIGLLFTSPAASAPDFEKEVAPILEQSCLFCHNADETKGDFDLSTRAAALSFEGGIVPGDSDASLLLEMVSGPDPVMPKKAAPLAGEQVTVLRDCPARLDCRRGRMAGGTHPCSRPGARSRLVVAASDDETRSNPVG